jgi:hypothetical protein
LGGWSPTFLSFFFLFPFSSSLAGTDYREMLVSGTRQQITACQEMVQDKDELQASPSCNCMCVHSDTQECALYLATCGHSCSLRCLLFIYLFFFFEKKKHPR